MAGNQYVGESSGGRAGSAAAGARVTSGIAGRVPPHDIEAEKAVLSALLIAPPAVLMGGTIPILTQALSRDLSDATRFHALVYAFNTIGAFGGAPAA